jgi:hypothetical protein
MSQEVVVLEGVSYAKSELTTNNENFLEKFESIVQTLHCFGVNWYSIFEISLKVLVVFWVKFENIC